MLWASSCPQPSARLPLHPPDSCLLHRALWSSACKPHLCHIGKHPAPPGCPHALLTLAQLLTVFLNEPCMFLYWGKIHLKLTIITIFEFTLQRHSCSHPCATGTSIHLQNCSFLPAAPRPLPHHIRLSVSLTLTPGSEVTWGLSFCHWLTSLSIRSSRFTRVGPRTTCRFPSVFRLHDHCRRPGQVLVLC